MTSTRRPWRPSSWSVRARAAVAAFLALAPLLAVAAIAAVGFQRHELTDSVALVAEEQARSRAEVLAGQGGPTEVGLGAAGSLGGEETLVQVVDPDGQVRAATGLRSGDPLAPPPPTAGPSRATFDGAVAGEEDRYLAVGVPVPQSAGWYVVAARSLETVDAATESTARLLGVGVPTLVALVTGISWLLAGRALAPVERLRSTSDEISTTGSGRRLPEVTGGDEVALLAVTLNQMLDRLDLHAHAHRQFVADASHELRSPVATIRTLLEVEDRAPTRDPATLRAELLSETYRLERLVTGLLSLARRDADGSTTHRADRVDLAAVAGADAERPRRIRVDVDLAARPGVVGDAAALGTLVGNLLDNADRHAVSRVTLRLHEKDGLVVLDVEDDGDGVPVEDAERVFDRFVRLDEARSAYDGGAGLGLAIARAVAEEHGGTLTCRSEPSALGGAWFRLTLPVSRTTAS